MRFQLLIPSLLVLSAMSLSIHEVRGIRYNKTVSTTSIDAHQTTLYEEKVITDAETSEKSVNYEGATMEEAEMTMVMRRTLSSSSKAASIINKKKKPQNQQHHHWMPSIHEDYYGPRRHKPTHH